MTREAAVAELRRHAQGLAPDDACVRRLFERISTSDEPETLRLALAEIGARNLLDEMASA